MKNNSLKLISFFLVLSVFISSCEFETFSEDPIQEAENDFSLKNDDEFIEPEELTETLNTRNVDLIIQSLNTIKSMRHTTEILPYVVDLWKINKTMDPELPWDVIEQDIVRINLGDLLIQAYKNNRIKIDPEEIRAFALKKANHSDPKVVADAIFIIIAIGNSDDLPLIKNAIKDENEMVLRSSASSFVIHCDSQQVKSILNEIKSETSDPDRKKFLDKVLKDLQNMPKSPWCN